MPEKLLLVDAHALIHRSYHAITTDLMSPGGEPTKAVYGFINTLLKVLKEVEPQYAAAAFDVGKSFRADRYPEYKATRPKMADDLRPQIQRSREFCEAFGIPVYARAGFEADDLIGALATQANERGLETIILTGDTDTLQLVNENIKVLMFVGRTSEMALYDEPKVEERYGLKPAQLIDLKALRGDTSDNIPGIPGVGDKTATKLILDYQGIEGIYEHLDRVEAKLREKLQSADQQVRLSKALVTIDRDAPAALDLDAARVGEYDRERVVDLFRELGFQSLLTRLPESAASTESTVPLRDSGDGAPVVKEQYSAVMSEAELDALVTKIRHAGAFVVDVETTDLDPLRAELVGIAIGLGQGEAYYIPVARAANPEPAPADAPKPATRRAAREKPQRSLFETTTESIAVARNADEPAHPFARLALDPIRSRLHDVFADERIRKYAHNAKYDWVVLERAGLPFQGLAFDTLIGAHLLEPPGQKLGLKELAFARFGTQMTEIEALIGKGKNQLSMSQVELDKITQYACADADYTYRLYGIYREQLRERGLDVLFYELELPLVPVIVDLERAGVLLDLELLKKLSEEITERMNALEERIYELVGNRFNLGSPVQLSDALFGKLGLSSHGLERTRTGQISTAAGVLESLRDQHEVIPLILEHRELAKLKGTYVDALPQLVNPETGRVHTSFNQTGTVTGRLSSSNPNLQNIPVRTELGRQVRRAFIAPPGSVLLSVDYSQVELRILAHVSRDPNMLKAFADGEDIHASTAALLFNVPIDQVSKEMRRLGKTINFGVVYGISDWGVAGRTELSLEDSRKLINTYNEKYAGVKEYMDRTKALARERGYVESLMGRRRYFPDLSSGRRLPIGVKNQSEREAINMPIQATAADIIKIAMVRLHDRLKAEGFKSRMILQVHDELVLECPESEVKQIAPLVCEIMQNAFRLDAPLQVEVRIGPNWDEMKEIQKA